MTLEESRAVATPMQDVPLDRIVANPWRDFSLNPINQDHVDELRRSIRRHGLFGCFCVRLRNGVYELAYGHHLIEAARQEGLTMVSAVVADADDDAMLHLMVNENALQGPGAAWSFRVVEMTLRRLLTRDQLNPRQSIKKVALCVMRYHGDGDETKSSLSYAQVREAIITLKQSGRYDDLVDGLNKADISVLGVVEGLSCAPTVPGTEPNEEGE
jgi:hypothetical protein